MVSEWVRPITSLFFKFEHGSVCSVLQQELTVPSNCIWYWKVWILLNRYNSYFAGLSKKEYYDWSSCVNIRFLAVRRPYTILISNAARIIPGCCSDLLLGTNQHSKAHKVDVMAFLSPIKKDFLSPIAHKLPGRIKHPQVLLHAAPTHRWSQSF